MVGAEVYVRVDHINIVELAQLVTLALLLPLRVGMDYKRFPLIYYFFQLSCVRCTACQHRAGRDSVPARLTNVEGAHVSCNSQACFLHGSVKGFRLPPYDHRHHSPWSYMLWKVHHIQLLTGTFSYHTTLGPI